MPSFVKPDGTTTAVPGVHKVTRVVSDLPQPAPTFHIAWLLGAAPEGLPYDVADKQFDHEDLVWWELFASASLAKKQFGRGSEIGTMMTYAKRAGLPQAYCVVVADLVRATVVAQSTGSTNEITIAARKWGAPGGHIKVKHSAGALEVTPLKNYAMLTANLSATGTRVYVTHNDWVKEGATLTLGDNATTNTTKTVVRKGDEINSSGERVYWVDIDSAVGGTGLATAQYGILLEYDENRKELPDTFADGDAMVDWLQKRSELLQAKKEGTFTNALPVAVSTATAIKDITAWGTVTDGESPAPTTTEWDDFITDLDASEFARFMEVEQEVPRDVYVGSPTHAHHVSYKDWAGAQRQLGYEMAVMSGADVGDTVIAAGDSTDPTWRTAALDSEDFVLFCGGIDRLAPYLSTGPQAWGRRVGGEVGHNLTNDAISYQEIEKRWTASQLETLHKAGVMTYRLNVGNTIAWVISQGLSTLQANNTSWDESTGKTPLVAQRDLADFTNSAVVREFNSLQVGANEVDPSTLAGVLTRKVEKQLKRRGTVVDFSITSITLNASGNGYDIEWRIQLPTTTDHIGLITTIYIGE